MMTVSHRFRCCDLPAVSMKCAAFFLCLCILTKMTVACPTNCSCTINIVNCTGPGELSWVQLIGDISGNTNSLTIQNADLNFIESDMVDDSFATKLLPKLAIQDCNIRDFKEESFDLTPHLTEVVIERSTLLNSTLSFHRLTKLTKLGLNWVFKADVSVEDGTSMLFDTHSGMDGMLLESITGLTLLESLDLSHNELEHVEPSMFSHLSRLRMLDLSDNHLSHLEKSMFTNLSSLQTVHLKNNHWNCSCKLQWLAVMLVHASEVFPSGQSVICHSPRAMINQSVVSVLSANFTCNGPNVTIPVDYLEIPRMHRVILQCVASQDPQTSVYWITPRGVLAHASQLEWKTQGYLNADSSLHYFEQPTNYNATVTALQMGQLLFENALYFYAGEYTCIAESQNGMASYSMNVTITADFNRHLVRGVTCGFLLSGAVLVLGIICGATRYLVLKFMGKNNESYPEMEVSFADEDDEELGPPGTYPFSPFAFFWSPSESRASPMKCVTPAEPLYDERAENSARVWETLEDVRALLRHGMARSVGRLRSGAEQVRVTSTRKLHTIKETSTVKFRSIRSTTGQYVHRVRSSTGQYVHRVRSSTGQYVHRVRSGVSIGMEQVKGNIQSFCELCGTGENMVHTVSTVSMATDLDSNQTSEVVKTITFV